MSGRELDRRDRLILNAIQTGFPIEARPYAVLAEKLSAGGESFSEEEVHGRVLALRRDGFIRRLGAVFQAGPLGYRSTLCAARVPEARLEDFRRLAGQAPQVTHNYLRSAELNAWFTFTTDRPEILAEFLKKLEEELGLTEVHVLEAEKIFKIKVDFKFSN